MKRLSIITICRNDATGLKKTIRSLRDQSYRDFEFIIVDGASEDETLNIITENKSMITHWISEPDTGIYNAQNKGVKMTQGDYCLFLNSGDYLADENVIKKFMSVETQAEIIYGDMIVENKIGSREIKKSPSKIRSLHMLKDTLRHPVSFIKRNLFDTFGYYDENFRIVADYEFFVRVIIRNSVSLYYLNFPVSVFDLSGVSSGKDTRMQLISERKAVQDMYFNPILLFLFRLYSKMRN